MIIILKSGVTDEQIKHVIERVESYGMQAHLSRGTHRTIIGVIGDKSQLQPSRFQAISGVADVISVLPPYKLASRDAHPEPSVVNVAGTKIGGGHLGMIAGPCAVESAERMDTIAGAVRTSGANLLRGGAFKPRTSPYAYQGMGEEGLKILRDAGQKHGMPVVTEVMDPRRVELVDRYADMIQIGARNMQNFVLLTEVGSTHKPVLLKRGMSATIVDLLMSTSTSCRRAIPMSCSANGASRASTPRREIYSTWRPCQPAKCCRTCRSSSTPAMPRAGPT